jgi:hypothetical protein
MGCLRLPAEFLPEHPATVGRCPRARSRALQRSSISRRVSLEWQGLQAETRLSIACSAPPSSIAIRWWTSLAMPRQPGCSSSQRGLANSLALRVIPSVCVRTCGCGRGRRLDVRVSVGPLGPCGVRRSVRGRSPASRSVARGRGGSASAAPRSLRGVWWCGSAPRPAPPHLAELLGVVVAVDVVERDQQGATGDPACERGQLLRCPLGRHQFKLRPWNLCMRRSSTYPNHGRVAARAGGAM